MFRYELRREDREMMVSESKVQRERESRENDEGSMNDIDGVGRMACWENKEGL